MRVKIVVLALSLAGAAFAQEPAPLHSATEFTKAIQDAPCDDGSARDKDGLCPNPVAAQRGFNLGARPRTHHSAPRASALQATADAAAPPNGAAQAVAVRPSLLSDLNISFLAGSAEMTPQAQADAKSFATALMQPPAIKRRFEIAGYTDASGSMARNVALSQARAEAVVHFLTANGVDPSRLEAKGYGPHGLARPKAPFDPANRRVEAHSLN